MKLPDLDEEIVVDVTRISKRFLIGMIVMQSIMMKILRINTIV